MRILVTGAAGFVGRNLAENLKNIRDGKNRTRPALAIDEIYEYTRESTPEDLDRFCTDCDFVFNLAGVNRPKDPAEFRDGNFGFASRLLEALKRHGNTCPVMLSSSIQATLAGRFQQPGSKAEVAVSELRGVFRSVHPCQIENEIAVRTETVQILRRAFPRIFIDFINGKSRSRPVLAIANILQVFRQVPADKSGRAGHQYPHCSFLHTILFTTPT